MQAVHDRMAAVEEDRVEGEDPLARFVSELARDLQSAGDTIADFWRKRAG